MHTLPSIAIVVQPTRMSGLLMQQATAGAAKFKLRRSREHEQLHRAARKRQPGDAVRAQRGAPVLSKTMAAELADVDEGESAEARLADLEADFATYKREAETYEQVVSRVRRDVDLGYPLSLVDRDFLPNFDFGRCAVVMVIGRDGLVANAAKYVGDLPIIAINPDPSRIDGVLLPFGAADARPAVQRVLAGRFNFEPVTLARVDLNDGQSMLAFNDFFVGCASHVSARYTLRVGDRAEPQSSSGVIVATGAGSTGWMSSVFNMAAGVAKWRGQPPPPAVTLAREERRLLWAVREPFRSRHSSAQLVAGMLEQDDELVVESLTPDRGVIFSDGVESDFLAFNSGTIARISVSQQAARLVTGR